MALPNGTNKLLWAFTHKQQREGFEDGFFIFLAWFKDDQLPMRIFIVPTSEKWTTHQTWSRHHGWRMKGHPKKALALNMDSGDLWPKLAMFESKFDLIEEKRLEIAAGLSAMAGTE